MNSPAAGDEPPSAPNAKQPTLGANEIAGAATASPSSRGDKPSALSAMEQFAHSANQSRRSSASASEDPTKVLLGWLRAQPAAIAAALLSPDRGAGNRALAAAVLAAAAVVIGSAPGRVLLLLGWAARRLFALAGTAAGTAVGVGLGLGLAAHVHDQLDVWERRQQQQNEDAAMMTGQGPMIQPVRSRTASSGSAMGRRSSWATPSSSSTRLFATSQQQLLQQQQSNHRGMSAIEDAAVSVLQDEQTYHSLMVSAGYHTPRYPIGHELPVQQLRGQVLRADQVPGTVSYPFTAVAAGVSRWKAVLVMRDLWPTLPASVQEALGKSIEYILRDFVAMWYHKADPGCKYQDPAQQQRQQQKEAGSIIIAGEEQSKQQQQMHHYARVMMYSVAVHRPLPFMDALYESCAVIFGNLATRVEHVNIFELLLLKWTRILAHTFKWYRVLRKNVKTKQLAHAQHHVGGRTASAEESSSSNGRAKPRRGQRHHKGDYSHVEESSGGGGGGENGNKSRGYVPVSEIAMTKEFLFAGKLHRAVTFGLDVPSFLFADASGRECGKPKRAADGSVVIEEERDGTRPDFTDDDVLAARLFETNLLSECELDYNRVVGHRMVRALVSRGDFGSSIVSTLLTEIMGGCVLTPIMSIFSPDYLNSWIVSGLQSKSGEDAASGEDKAENTSPKVGRGPSGEEVAPAGDTIEIVLIRDQQEQRVDGAIEATTKASDEERRSRAYSDDSFGIGNDIDSAPTDPNTTTAQVLGPSGNCGLSIDALSAPNTGPSYSFPGDSITTILAMALIDLQQYVDFEECRDAREQNQEIDVDWDDDGCRAAVVRLVLVIESALTHGRCTYRPRSNDGDGAGDDNLNELLEESEMPVEVTLPDYESATLTQILMELTSDIDAFEERVASENALMREKVVDQFENMIPEEYQPTAREQSTLRTLIAAWLHTGQIYRTVTLLVQAHTTVLAPYYNKTAFLRSRENANGFVRQLRVLEGVGVLVDTMSVLASPRLENTNSADLSALVKKSAQSPGISLPQHAEQLQGDGNTLSSMLSAQFMSTSSTPRHLDFNRNESFAASLRSERERRMQSWERIVNEDSEEGVPIIHRTRGVSEEDIALHKELHHIARIFYAGTNMLALRDAARRTSVEVDGGSHSAKSPDADGGVQVSLMTVETACPRRRIEVPDDDSSFLLRAQPRPLNAVGVHRDQRNHDQSFKCFAATYDEPALNTGSEHYTGGRYIRRCLIRYYPIDRTASVALQSDVRKLDQRKSKSSVPDTITLGQSSRSAPFLSAEFLKERHLCQRWVPKGTTRSQSLLASSVMEATDFTSTPRSGRAIEFVYRMNFFERPMLDLGGKHFTVHDSSSLGAHRADASALEMSDASLSAALLTLGASEDDKAGSTSAEDHRQGVEMGKDGYPVVWMKFSRKQDDAHVEVKPYRTSFVRAALMITAARQEAQLRCLVQSVKAGSAKNATKALTDAYLKPSLKLIEYAGSPSRGKQSVLLRDLKLGVNHIDRGQLRRNALLSPRYPTELLDLSAVVEDVVQAPDVKGVDLFGTSSSVFKIKCSATVALVASDEELIGDAGYRTEDGSFAETYKEEWVVYRSLKEFQAIHKHLKFQVSATESSGTAGSRLVGAATAAFAATTASLGRTRQRKMLIPSLSQASKAGALGVTKKLILKRKEILDGYLGYLLSPGHLLGRCSELLLFLGASFPLDPNVRVGETIHSTSDPLGRTEMTRSVLQLRAQEKPNAVLSIPDIPRQSRSHRAASLSSAASVSSQEDDMLDDDEEADQYRKSGRKINMIPAVKNKIDKVTLPQVRNRIFELLRYQFGFENASFARNRMLAALKAASFAVTSAAEFRKTLYKLHIEHVNSEAISGWINFLCDMLWPDGVFYESKPPLSPEEMQAQADQAKELLHGNFPDQVRAILGQELTRDGMDIFHEMLQNRMVVKSMAYMLFDLLWVEVFPEIGDVLPCGAALDIDA